MPLTMTRRNSFGASSDANGVTTLHAPSFRGESFARLGTLLDFAVEERPRRRSSVPSSRGQVD